MPLLIATNQIPNAKSQGSQIRKSGIYLLANSHPISLALVSLHAHHFITRYTISRRSRFPTRPKRDKKAAAPHANQSDNTYCTWAGIDPKLAARRLFAKPNCRTQEASDKPTSKPSPAVPSRDSTSDHSLPTLPPDARPHSPEHGVSTRTRVTCALKDRGVERGVELNIVDAVYLLVLRKCSPPREVPCLPPLSVRFIFAVQQYLNRGLEC